MPYVDIDPSSVSWIRGSAADVRSRIVAERGRRPAVCAIDGHSGSGKSTLAAAIASGQSDIAIVHTDDLAWHHSFFGWADLLIDGVLRTLRAGYSVDFRPPAWPERGRTGSISVPFGTSVVLVEGVGAARREARPFLDYVIWVHVPEELGRERVIARGDDDAAFRQRWMAEENALFEDDPPWTTADLWVDGSHSGGGLPMCAMGSGDVARNGSDGGSRSPR
ncbi:MAG: hypothetical protein PGN37_27215 [Mycobacterium kyogaense]|uniref:uridine kinase family protein n=1 Tax=Mycobacterium kyogaense TaxID=2212479 RepID=UPI002FFA65DC